MNVDELAEELAEFWLPAFLEAGWAQRFRILKEIEAQLRTDMEKPAEYEALSPRFVAALIERLGASRVESAAQAAIYESSYDRRHRDAAAGWRRGLLPFGLMTDDRRQSPRQRLDANSEIWVRGQRAACRFVDLSSGGARVMLRDVTLPPGTPVRLVVPDAGVRDAKVVFRDSFGVGVQFVDQPSAA